MHIYELYRAAIFLARIITSSPIPMQLGFQKPLVQYNDKLDAISIRNVLNNSGIIGDILEDFIPSYYIDLMYSQHDTRVDFGNQVEVADVRKRPRFIIHQIPTEQEPMILQNITFTLILVDPDAVTNHHSKGSELYHWILTDITSAAHSSGSLPLSTEDRIEVDLEEDYAFPFREDDESSSKPREVCEGTTKGGKCLPGELKAYHAPVPRRGRGWHRLVFILLTGDSTHLQLPKPRQKWSEGFSKRGVSTWAHHHGLEAVGANFFFARSKRT